MSSRHQLTESRKIKTSKSTETPASHQQMAAVCREEVLNISNLIYCWIHILLSNESNNSKGHIMHTEAKMNKTIVKYD